MTAATHPATGRKTTASFVLLGLLALAMALVALVMATADQLGTTAHIALFGVDLVLAVSLGTLLHLPGGERAGVPTLGDRREAARLRRDNEVLEALEPLRPQAPQASEASDGTGR
ncbi:hypothetical protein ACIQGZ_03200 [Streptomyces sp. NPDC092296]|uniref:hypothetical protein n=1 Tax=Streptomyces sp. NPDC092296 TaxID=3366012 RepID=UPI003803EAC5